MQELHNNLLTRGDKAALKKARDLTKEWEFAKDAGTKGFPLRLDWSVKARASLTQSEFPIALRAEFLAEIKDAAAQAPANWKERLDFDAFDDLSEEETNAICAARMLDGFKNAWADPRAILFEIEFWLEKDGKAVPDRVRRALPIVLKESPNDLARFLGLLGLLLNDEVDAEMRKEFEPMLKPYRNPKKHPMTFIALRGYDAWTQAAEEEFDLEGFEEAFNRVDGPFESMVAFLYLRSFYHNRDFEAIADLLDELDEEVLARR